MGIVCCVWCTGTTYEKKKCAATVDSDIDVIQRRIRDRDEDEPEDAPTTALMFHHDE